MIDPVREVVRHP